MRVLNRTPVSYTHLKQEKGEQPHTPREVQRRIEEYAVECSILKVYGSEMLSLVADELVATMGGYGYVEEYPAERTYREDVYKRQAVIQLVAPQRCSLVTIRAASISTGAATP